MTRRIVTTGDELKQAVREAVADAFRDVGIVAHDHTEVLERRRDFEFLHDLRTTTEGTKAKLGLALLLSAMGGFCTMLVLGFKAWLLKP